MDRTFSASISSMLPLKTSSSTIMSGVSPSLKALFSSPSEKPLDLYVEDVVLPDSHVEDLYVVDDLPVGSVLTSELMIISNLDVMLFDYPFGRVLVVYVILDDGL